MIAGRVRANGRVLPGSVDEAVAALADLDGAVTVHLHRCLDRIAVLQRELAEWRAVGEKVLDVQRAFDNLDRHQARQNQEGL